MQLHPVHARTPRSGRSIGWLAAFLIVPLPAPSRQESASPKAALGALVPDHTFREFLAGGDGRQKLSEFRGQPVLVVNWTDTDFGRGAAKDVEKLSKELVPDGLVTILLDTHNKTAEEIEAAVMRLYPGSPARLTQNQKLPIEYLENGPPPNVALIGVDGTLLIAGSYTVDLPKAMKLVRTELKRAESGWGEHEAARKVRALLHGKHRLAEARAALEAALAAEPAQAELLAVRAELEARWSSWSRAVSYFQEHGQYVRAQDEARALAEAVKGDPEWEAPAAALVRGFEDEEAARELELDKKLGALLAPLSKKSPERESAKLRKFAEEAGASRVGKRALHLAEITALAAE